MPKKDFVSYTLIILFPLFLLSVATFTIVFDSTTYPPLFEKSKIYSYVPNAESMNKAVLRYLLENEESLPQGFNEKEQMHMEDVRSMFAFLKRVLMMFPLLVFAAMVKWGQNRKKMLGQVLNEGSIIACCLFLVIIPLSAFAFPSLFDAFHRVFFDEGTYLFDPSIDLLVQLYPEELFFALAWRIALFAALLASLIGFFGHLMKKDLKQEAR